MEEAKAATLAIVEQVTGLSYAATWSQGSATSHTADLAIVDQTEQDDRST